MADRELESQREGKREKKDIWSKKGSIFKDLRQSELTFDGKFCMVS